jgi:hypothetical protein
MLRRTQLFLQRQGRNDANVLRPRIDGILFRLSFGPTPLRASFSAVGGATYRIVLYSYRDKSDTATLTWNQPTAPYFVLHPNSEKATNEVVDGYSLTLSGIALGNPVPTFQWKKNGSNISGATSTNYTISSMTTNDAGSYVLVASNTNGTATSESTYVKYFGQGSQPLEEPYWTNSALNLPFYHVSGYKYTVWGSTNFTNWVNLGTNTVPFTFTDSNTNGLPYRFYHSQFLP